MKPKIKSVFIIKSKAYIQSYKQPWLSKNRSGNGTGFCVEINKKKYIITNHHVIDRGIFVTVGDINSDRESKVLFYDIISDLAILECPYEDAIPLKIGEASTGDDIVLQGFPLHFHNINVSKGIISRITKFNNGAAKVLIFASDIQANPGNSGGPAFNSRGQVIGVLTWGVNAYNNSQTIVAGLIPFFTLNNFINNFKEGNPFVLHRNRPFSYQYINTEIESLVGTKEGVIIWDKKPLHLSHIEGIKILENGQIQISDMLKHLGYTPLGTELVPFKYLIPLLKKEVTYTIDNKKIKINSQEIGFNFNPVEYAVYGEYIFVPTSIGLSMEIGYIEANKVFVSLARNNYRMENKILDISWRDFLDKLKTSRDMIVIPILNDNWRFFLDPKNTEKTKKTMSVFTSFSPK